MTLDLQNICWCLYIYIYLLNDWMIIKTLNNNFIAFISLLTNGVMDGGSTCFRLPHPAYSVLKISCTVSISCWEYTDIQILSSFHTIKRKETSTDYWFVVSILSKKSQVLFKIAWTVLFITLDKWLLMHRSHEPFSLTVANSTCLCLVLYIYVR